MKNFRYRLPAHWTEKLRSFEEFANGGMQVTVRLSDGKIYSQILISNVTAIVAIRNFEDLPFSISEIADMYQTAEDKNPEERGGWKFWDKWE
jgi:hypothetical protein